MGSVNIKIDGHSMQVPKGITVLEAARMANIRIPTLCFLKDINEIGACRICVVEIKGARSLQASCVYPVSEGLEVMTQTPAVRESRRVTLELILSNHDQKCLACERSGSCELQKLSEELNVKQLHYEGASIPYDIDDASASIVRDPNKCVLCRRCVSMCKNVQGVSAIDTMERGFRTRVTSSFEMSLGDAACAMCGQCINVCPTGALREKDATRKVWSALGDPSLHVVVQTAPAVRVALGEEFGLPIGTRVTGKMAAALKRLGFAKVFDTNTAADLTILEEGTELIGRIRNGGKLPLITSCSPGWIKFCEHEFPDMLDHLSTCKSPHAMYGATLKTYYAGKHGIDPAKMFVVSVMPCTAKKFEAERPEISADGRPDVDAVLTTRELARMIREAGIDFAALEDEEFDAPMGVGSGAATIFGATGGVTEAALRTVVEALSGHPESEVEYAAVRGVQGVKEATVKAGGVEIRAAVVSGLANAKALLRKVAAGEAEYHFIEVMACPGGCVNGGGQPVQPSRVRSWTDLRAERARGLYAEDRDLPVRKSHENETVQRLYAEYFGEPNSHRAHEVLHTKYVKRDRFGDGPG